MSEYYNDKKTKTFKIKLGDNFIFQKLFYFLLMVTFVLFSSNVLVGNPCEVRVQIKIK